MARNGKKDNSKRSRSKQPQYTRRQREVESEDMKKRPNRVRPDDRRGDSCFEGKPNDWRWYAQNQQLVTDYANYPFGTPLGNTLMLGNDYVDTGAVPGIMVLEFVPTIGYAAEETDPINVAMRRVYSFVRHANSGASNYDAPDLMMYLLAVDSAMMYLEWMKRVYGVMLDYTPFNRYYPRALVTGMRASFEDIEQHLNDFRGYINQFAVKLAQLWIPNSMSVLARHSWMCQGLYVDGNTAKAQTYFYQPTRFYQFTLDAQGAGSLRQVILSENSTFAQIVQLGNSLLAPMITNEDFGIMAGDILKAYGNGGIVSVSGITENYQILPVYSEEVLSQIENSTCFGDLLTGSADVTQETAVGTGYLVSQPKCIGPSGNEFHDANVQQQMINFLGMRKLLNFHHSSVTPEEVMVATRLTNIPNATYFTETASEKYYLCDMVTAGTEIVTGYRIFRNVGNDIIQNWTEFTVKEIGPNEISIKNIGDTVPAITQFDWNPHIWMVATVVSSSGASIRPAILPLADLEWYTYLDQTNLKNMTMAALLSEFTVPQIG